MSIGVTIERQEGPVIRGTAIVMMTTAIPHETSHCLYTNAGLFRADLSVSGVSI